MWNYGVPMESDRVRETAEPDAVAGTR